MLSVSHTEPPQHQQQGYMTTTGNNDVFVTLYHLMLTGDSILIQTEFRGHFASCCAVMIKHNIAWSSTEIRNSACCGELSNVKKQSRESDAADEMNQSWCKEL